MHLQWTSWLTLAVLCMYIWNVIIVGRMRNVHKVPAPAMDGPPEFLRAMRVQANTVEQMVFFFPALWLCAIWSGDIPAALLGLVWLFGRIIYALAYLKDASKRSTGFLISSVAAIALMLGAVVGLSGVLK
ncbi:MAPEG family protein [Undibacterium sp. Di27W]|uniref:MAPEG family protein n=1 Tax=Undibacterium sp. Di27W TaxID=3413036 RepID=UPI003BF2D72D